MRNRDINEDPLDHRGGKRRALWNLGVSLTCLVLLLWPTITGVIAGRVPVTLALILGVPTLIITLSFVHDSIVNYRMHDAALLQDLKDDKARKSRQNKGN